MGRYIQRRIAIGIPILLAISVLIFPLLQLTPGDPIDAYLPPDSPVPPEQREAMRRQLGLDRPLPVQYVYWLKEAAPGQPRLPDQDVRAGQRGDRPPDRADAAADGHGDDASGSRSGSRSASSPRSASTRCSTTC